MYLNTFWKKDFTHKRRTNLFFQLEIVGHASNNYFHQKNQPSNAKLSADGLLWMHSNIKSLSGSVNCVLILNVEGFVLMYSIWKWCYENYYFTLSSSLWLTDHCLFLWLKEHMKHCFSWGLPVHLPLSTSVWTPLLSLIQTTYSHVKDSYCEDGTFVWLFKKNVTPM